MARSSYYSESLSAERLKLCYDLAPLPAQQYLEAEIDYVLQRIQRGDRVLELGCGYGRVATRLAAKARMVIGIDLSFESLRFAQTFAADRLPALAQMDAVALGFRPAAFDLVCCAQNGVSAFHVDPKTLLQAALRVTRRRGHVQFFSYSDAFWEQRLQWFRIQAAHGLIGPIEEEQTHDGTIVCSDGFTATTVSAAQFAELSAGLGAAVEIKELAYGSIVCDITV